MLRRFLWSVTSAIAGAIAVFPAAMCYAGADKWTKVYRPILLIIAFFTAYAWLLFILPLTLRFRESHKIYYFRWSIPFGMGLSILALGIYQIAIDLAMRRPSTLLGFVNSPQSAMILLFPLLFGTCVATVLSALARYYRKKAERTGAANPCAFGTSGISAAEQPRMPEASRDT
jgi:ABC-type polysaccharide/polyol phosphate export permease